MNKLLNALFSLKDEAYKEFHQKLMPTVNPDTVIGVRVPEIRKLSKSAHNTKEAEAFINNLPHKYYEENNLHAFLIEKIKDFDEAIRETERFLPYIDNWATCDMFMPAVFKKNTDIILPYIFKWIKSEHTYTVRFAIGLLMKLYLDEHYNDEYPMIVASVESSEYYIKMMIAWYFATALSKQYDGVIRYITERKLDKWTHNKTIQKAIESNRIDYITKEYLRKQKV